MVHNGRFAVPSSPTQLCEVLFNRGSRRSPLGGCICLLSRIFSIPDSCRVVGTGLESNIKSEPLFIGHPSARSRIGMGYLSGNVRTGLRRANAPGFGIVLACAIASALLLTACSRGRAEAPQAVMAAPVKVQKVDAHEIGDTSEYVATIKSRNSATIMSDVEGWIFNIRVKSGDSVKKGQTLMEIDPRRQQATVSSFDSQRASKEATLQWAKLQLERNKTLYESGVVSKQDLDQAQSNYDAAVADVKSLDAQVNQQQVQLKYYSVFSPTDG